MKNDEIKNNLKIIKNKLKIIIYIYISYCNFRAKLTL